MLVCNTTFLNTQEVHFTFPVFFHNPPTQLTIVQQESFVAVVVSELTNNYKSGDFI